MREATTVAEHTCVSGGGWCTGCGGRARGQVGLGGAVRAWLSATARRNVRAGAALAEHVGGSYVHDVWIPHSIQSKPIAKLSRNEK